MNDTIGIDISKDKLDAYWLANREHRQFCNDQKGVKALALWARGAGITRVIFESTGVYHRLVETSLAEHVISFARVNPRQARRFCEGTGQLAKTGRVGAAMLAKMGALLELKTDEPPPSNGEAQNQGPHHRPLRNVHSLPAVSEYQEPPQRGWSRPGMMSI